MTISNESESIDIEDLCRIAKLPVQDAFSNRLYHICLFNSINQLQRSYRFSSASARRNGSLARVDKIPLPLP